jgi:hypothetical protein
VELYGFLECKPLSKQTRTVHSESIQRSSQQIEHSESISTAEVHFPAAVHRTLWESVVGATAGVCHVRVRNDCCIGDAVHCLMHRLSYHWPSVHLAAVTEFMVGHAVHCLMHRFSYHRAFVFRRNSWWQRREAVVTPAMNAIESHAWQHR